MSPKHQFLTEDVDIFENLTIHKSTPESFNNTLIDP